MSISNPYSNDKNISDKSKPKKFGWTIFGYGAILNMIVAVCSWYLTLIILMPYIQQQQGLLHQIDDKNIMLIFWGVCAVLGGGAVGALASSSMLYSSWYWGHRSVIISSLSVLFSLQLLDIIVFGWEWEQLQIVGWISSRALNGFLIGVVQDSCFQYINEAFPSCLQAKSKTLLESIGILSSVSCLGLVLIINSYFYSFFEEGLGGEEGLLMYWIIFPPSATLFTLIISICCLPNTPKYLQVAKGDGMQALQELTLIWGDEEKVNILEIMQNHRLQMNSFQGKKLLFISSTIFGIIVDIWCCFEYFLMAVLVSFLFENYWEGDEFDGGIIGILLMIIPTIISILSFTLILSQKSSKGLRISLNIFHRALMATIFFFLGTIHDPLDCSFNVYESLAICVLLIFLLSLNVTLKQCNRLMEDNGNVNCDYWIEGSRLSIHYLGSLTCLGFFYFFVGNGIDFSYLWSALGTCAVISIIKPLIISLKAPMNSSQKQ